MKMSSWPMSACDSLLEALVLLAPREDVLGALRDDSSSSSGVRPGCRSSRVSCSISLPRIDSRSPIAASKMPMRVVEPLEDPLLDRVLDREVEDVDDVGLLAIAVETTDALLDPHRVPRKVVVDHHVRELEVEALGGDLGREHDVRSGLVRGTRRRSRAGPPRRRAVEDAHAKRCARRPRTCGVARARCSSVLRKNEKTRTFPSRAVPFSIASASAATNCSNFESIGRPRRRHASASDGHARRSSSCELVVLLGVDLELAAVSSSTCDDRAQRSCRYSRAAGIELATWRCGMIVAKFANVAGLLPDELGDGVVETPSRRA